jgi:hypothetical protein
MSFTTVCQILLGSLLVVLGMFASAVADRIRGLRARLSALPFAQPEPLVARQPNRRIPRPFIPPGPPIASAPPIHGAAPPQVMAAIKSKKSPDEIMADDVLSALVAAGYTKRIAETAVKACIGDERATTETWVRAALRRCNSRVSA